MATKEIIAEKGKKFVRNLLGETVQIPSNTNLYARNNNDVKLIQKFSGRANTYQITDKLTFYGVKFNDKILYIKDSDLQNGGQAPIKPHLASTYACSHFN